MKTLRTLLLSLMALVGTICPATASAADGQPSVEFLLPSTLAAITNNLEIANVTVDRAYYDIYWTVNCATDPDFFFGGSCGLASRGAGTYTIVASTPSAEPVELNGGNVYTFTFQTSEFGWDAYQTIATFEVTGSGRAAEQFSDIQLLSIGCEPNSWGEYPFRNEYTLTFSDPVYEVKAFAPQGLLGTDDFPVRKSDTEGKVWTVNCSSAVDVEGSFELHIQARDAATHLRLRGTYGLDNSFIYTIKCNESIPDNPGNEPELPDEELEIATLTIDGQVYQLSEENAIELASYPEGAIITVTLGDEAIKKVSYEIIDHTLGEVYKSIADLNKGQNGQWTAEMPRTYDLVAGHIYYVHVVARDGMSSFTSNVLYEYNFLIFGINGNVSTYSTVALTSITPDPDVIIREATPVITLTFSDAIASILVTAVLGQLSSETLDTECVTTTDHKTWQIAVPEGIINKGALSLNVVAIDQEGCRVTDHEYGVGTPENCYLQFGWASTIGLPTPQLLEDGTNVEAITQLHFAYEGIGLNQDNRTATWQNITIEDGNGPCNLLLTADMFTTTGDASVGATQLILTLPTPLTEPGLYTITVPAYAFMLGHDNENFYNGDCKFSIEVVAEIPMEGIKLHEGENILPVYAPATAYFTAQHNCKVLIEAEDQYAVTYDGQTYPFSYVPTNSPANICEINHVAAGTSVVLHSDFVMNPLIRITTLESGSVVPVEVNSVSPAQGTSDFWSNNGLLNISFNRQVTLSGANLLVGETIAPLTILHVTSALSIDMGPTLNALLLNGTLKVGDTFNVHITGLRDALDPDNIYGGNGELMLTFVAPEPQYGLLSATVDGQRLTTDGLNDYAFLSYYAPDSQDGVFVLEFESAVAMVSNVLLQMGNRDLDAQGKYHESSLPFSIEGNKVIIDARGVLRTLNILFPAVVEEEAEPGENVNEGLGTYDHEHLTLRVSNVIDTNGNAFRAEQAGNIGSYSFYMNYRELFETINLDGDNKQAGDKVVAGENITLWLSSNDVTFDAIQVTYLTQTEEDAYEANSVLQTEFTTEADPYQGIIIAFVMPAMPDVAVGQTVRVALHNAITADGMPHDLGIDFVAGDPSGIHSVRGDRQPSAYVWTLQGIRVRRDAVPAGTLFIE